MNISFRALLWLKKINVCRIALLGVSGIVVGCSHVNVAREEAQDGLVFRKEMSDKTEILDYAHLRRAALLPQATPPGPHQPSMNPVVDPSGRPAKNDQIVAQSRRYAEQNMWKKSLDVLLTYKPTLTFDQRIANQLVFVALKLEYYDLAIEQIKLSLSQNIEPARAHLLHVALAHVYLLAQKYDPADNLFRWFASRGTYADADKYLFVSAYEQKKLEAVRRELRHFEVGHRDYLFFHLLVARLENDEGQFEAGETRLKSIYKMAPENNAVAAEYVMNLISQEKMAEALVILDEENNYLKQAQSYHFLKAAIYFKQGEKSKFQEQLKRLSLKKPSREDLTSYLLGEISLSKAVSALFKTKDVEKFELSRVVRTRTENSISAILSAPIENPAILVENNLKAAASPNRKPASMKNEDEDENEQWP